MGMEVWSGCPLVALLLYTLHDMCRHRYQVPQLHGWKAVPWGRSWVLKVALVTAYQSLGRSEGKRCKSPAPDFHINLLQYWWLHSEGARG